MPSKPSDKDLALRDGIASLPEMEDIQLELTSPQQDDPPDRFDAGQEQITTRPEATSRREF